MKHLSLFLKVQGPQILFLALFIIAPYLLTCMFLPGVPHMHYFFIIAIFVIRNVILNEKMYKQKIRPIIQNELSKNLEKTPSEAVIFKTLSSQVKIREFTLLLCAVIIITIAIIFKKL